LNAPSAVNEKKKIANFAKIAASTSPASAVIKALSELAELRYGIADG
jgi:hypothetical protein